MSKQNIEGLLTQLHAKFSDSDTSPEQEELMQRLQSQLADWDGPLPADGNIVSTTELLLEEVREKHPQLSRLIKELLDALGSSGI